MCRTIILVESGTHYRFQKPMDTQAFNFLKDYGVKAFEEQFPAVPGNLKAIRNLHLMNLIRGISLHRGHHSSIPRIGVAKYYAVARSPTSGVSSCIPPRPGSTSSSEWSP